jgi:hypothetical protein
MGDIGFKKFYVRFRLDVKRGYATQGSEDFSGDNAWRTKCDHITEEQQAAVSVGCP